MTELPPKNKNVEKQVEGQSIEEKEPNILSPEVIPKAKPPPPFPQKFKKKKEEECFAKFIELLK